MTLYQTFRFLKLIQIQISSVDNSQQISKKKKKKVHDAKDSV